MNIALISDNHRYDGHDVLPHVEDCDEIWHAGDIGSLASLESMQQIAPIRGVYGNIDDKDVRAVYPLELTWECEGMRIYMTHIGGYPSRYYARVRKQLTSIRPDIYICGHSHICKVMRDSELNLIHMNPGAYGHHGFHKIRTILKFKIENKVLSDVKVVELGKRGVSL